MKAPVTWDRMFMNIAKIVATKSKDPRTKVGAVLVSPDNRNIHIGYNGFITDFPETKGKWERPNKYNYVIHAETNAILNSKADLSNHTLYVTMHPCEKCSLLIAQSGISRVVYLNNATVSSNVELAKEILLESNIKVEKYHG